MVSFYDTPRSALDTTIFPDSASAVPMRDLIA